MTSPNAYIEGWRLGLKALAIYRDGSKESQPLVHQRSEGTDKSGGDKSIPRSTHASASARHAPVAHSQVQRRRTRRLHHRRPVRRRPPGELFITMAKEGSTIGGLMDTIGTASR